MNAFTLQSHEAVARWDELAPLLKLIELMELPLSAIKAMVASCEAQVWCIGDPIECVLLTKIENTTECRYGLCWMGAGDLRLVDMGYRFVGPWFKSMGCEYVQIIGRRGLKKFLPDFKEQSVNLVKQL